jgi:hypothetical protein
MLFSRYDRGPATIRSNLDNTVGSIINIEAQVLGKKVVKGKVVPADQRGDVWPNKDTECARIERKAFLQPKTFMV